MIAEIVAALGPKIARVDISQWPGVGWGVYVHDFGQEGGSPTQLVGALRPTLEEALADCLEQAEAHALI